GDEPARAGQIAQAGERPAEVDRAGVLAAAVLQQRGEVGAQRHQHRESDPDLHRARFPQTPPWAAWSSAAGRSADALRTAATAIAEVRQALAITRFGAAGVRAISKAISALRWSFERSSRELDSGAEPS